MKLRLTSDGTAEGSKVEDAETGETQTNVAEVRIKISGLKPVEAEILLIVKVDAIDLTADFVVAH